MKKTILLSSLVGLLAASMPAKATEYIYAGSLALIGNSAYSVETNTDKTYLVKYSFPAFEESKRLELTSDFPNILASDNGFAISYTTDYQWSPVSEGDKETLKKRGFAPDSSGSQTLTETTVYTSYNSDLDKVTEKTITNVYVFSTVYEDNPSTLADDGLAGAVDEKFCGKKKSKHGKCKKILVRTK